MLSDKEIVSFRVSDGNTVKMEYRSSLYSTAELAREYANLGYPDRYVIFTERQTSTAPHHSDSAQEGLYLSCILRPSIFPSQAGLIGPMSAVALATALEEHTDKKMGICWVSDVYCDGVKLGGCTVEGKLDNFTSYEYMIINFAVQLDKKKFPPRLADMIREVFEPDNSSVSMIIARTLLNNFFNLYRELKTPEKFMNVYTSKFMLKGKKIRFIDEGRKKRCRVVEIDKKTCTLIIEDSDGQIRFINSPSSVIIPNKI